MANMNFGVNILPKANNTYTLGNSDYKWNIFANTLNGVSLSNIITDIQINGTSIISNNIANFPLASTTDFGLVKIGNGLLINSNTTKIEISAASSTKIKEGTDFNYPIVPVRQHVSVFYGLAKAAGDSTQSASSNAVGTYTDSAKTAIQKMLDVYQAPWELIRSDDMTNATEADIEITVDDDGNTFELTDIIVQMMIYSKDNTASSMGDYGRVRYIYGTNSTEYDDTISGAISVAAGGSARGFYTYIEQQGPLLRKMMTMQAAGSNTGTLSNYTTNNFSSQLAPVTLIDSPRYYNKIIFKKITGSIKFKIYGKRKWT